MDKKTKISLVVSFRNEEDVIDDFITETTGILKKIENLEYEIIFVDDNSTDNSLEKLIQYHIQDNKRSDGMTFREVYPTHPNEDEHKIWAKQIQKEIEEINGKD